MNHFSALDFPIIFHSHFSLSLNSCLFRFTTSDLLFSSAYVGLYVVNNARTSISRPINMKCRIHQFSDNLFKFSNKKLTYIFIRIYLLFTLIFTFRTAFQKMFWEVRENYDNFLVKICQKSITFETFLSTLYLFREKCFANVVKLS